MAYQLTDHLGNVRAVVTTDGTISSSTDYYPFGMAMPNRNTVDANGYRYAYQGQEKDPETGKEAFQLRLWDSRIGRWISPDPYGQFASPYVGMGNDPVNGIDPDGGYRTWWQAFKSWVGGGFSGSINKSDNPGTPWHKYSVNSELKRETGFSTKFGLDDKLIQSYGYGNNGTNYFNRGVGYMKTAKYDWTNKWKDDGILYDFSNDFYVTGQTLNPFDSQLTNINGSGIVKGSNDHLDNGANVFMTIFPYGRGAAVSGNSMKGLGYVNKMHASQFSSVFKGNLAKASPKIRGVINKQIINRVITMYNTQMSGGMFIYGRAKSLNKKEVK